jgi:alpha-ribazole phosphatase
VVTDLELHLWRHPPLRAAEGLCVGALDWPLDARRARRLARRIEAHARTHLLPRAIAASPLSRCRAVAEHLRALGWRVRIDARLTELDFGRWQGRRWQDIAREQITAWERDFLHFRPGGGESLAELRARLAAFIEDAARGRAPPLAITHAGCIGALMTLAHASPSAADWPAPPRCGGYLRLVVRAAAAGAAAPARASATNARR